VSVSDRTDLEVIQVRDRGRAFRARKDLEQQFEINHCRCERLQHAGITLDLCGTKGLGFLLD